MRRLLILLALLSSSALGQQILAPIFQAPPAGGGAGPAYVNGWAGGNNQCSTATCSLTIAPVAGHTLRVLGLYRSDLGSISSVKDSASNSLSAIYNITGIGGHYGQIDYCESSIPGGLTSITITTSVNADTEFIVFELSGVGCTADGASNNTSTVSGGTVSSPSITPTAGDAVAVLPSILAPGTGAITVTAGSGYSHVVTSGTSNNDGAVVSGEFQGVASASGSYSAAATYTPIATTVNANIAATK